MLNPQQELLDKAKSMYPLSKEVMEAYLTLPRHKFINRFSPDYSHWLKVKPEYMSLIYADTTLLLYDKGDYISTISQPSFVLLMLEILDLQPGMKVFELGAGSGWNAAMMGYLVGKTGLVKSYEIIPEMTKEALAHVAQFDLPQVQIIQGDALEEIWDEEEFDRGIFTAGAWDLPGVFFDALKVGGKFLFVLKTNEGDLLLAMEKHRDHFEVYKKIHCQFVSVTGSTVEYYHNNLSALQYVKSKITIWPQGTLYLGENVIAGRDMIFKWE